MSAAKPAHRLFLSTQQSGTTLLSWGPYDQASESLEHSSEALTVGTVPDWAYAQLDAALAAIDYADNDYPSQLPPRVEATDTLNFARPGGPCRNCGETAECAGCGWVKP